MLVAAATGAGYQHYGAGPVQNGAGPVAKGASPFWYRSPAPQIAIVRLTVARNPLAKSDLRHP